MKRTSAIRKMLIAVASCLLLLTGSLCANFYQVGIQVADAKSGKVLSQPQLTTTEGRPFNMKVGQTTADKLELGPVEVGVTISGTVKEIESGAIRYAVLLAVREMTDQAADGKSMAFTVSEILTNGEIAAGVPNTFHLGGKKITITINLIRQTLTPQAVKQQAAQ